MVQEAVSSLFQAADVFQAASQPAYYGQQAHVAASCDMIKRVINNLLVNLTSSYSKSTEGVCLPTPQTIAACATIIMMIVKTPDSQG